MTMRLRFWLAMLDFAHTLRLPHPVYLWLVARASDATNWGSPFDEVLEEQKRLVLQLVARLDHLGLDGEVRVVVHLRGGTVDLLGKSARAHERGS